jgi:hypothetical protein
MKKGGKEMDLTKRNGKVRIMRPMSYITGSSSKKAPDFDPLIGSKPVHAALPHLWVFC